MRFDFHNNGTATSIRMKENIKEAINNFRQNITQSAMSPAKQEVFEIDEESGELTDQDQETCHSTVAKLLLYMSIRGRLDNILPIDSLCRR